MSCEVQAFENCFLTFPSLYSGCKDSAELKYDDNVPVVILLGWAGCQWRHLKKYSAIYEKKCITVCYIASIENVFFRSNKLRIDASKILQLIVDHKLHEHPIFVHTFSNGGCRAYCYLSHLIHNSKTFATITLRGVIFDSCPSRPRISNDGDFWSFMCDDPASCPHLYLYSVPDNLIPYKDVEQMIAVRLSRGVDVSSQCWDDSAHVSHLVAHRETYIAACLSFLEHCSHNT